MLKQLMYLFIMAGVGTYLVFGVYLYVNQRKFMYFPSIQDFDGCVGFAEAEKVKVKGTRMYYQHHGNQLVVVYHGNGGSACDRAFLKNIFNELGLSYLFVEYAGYANDSRQPSMELILQDVKNAVEFIKGSGYDQVFVLGESLGSGPASYQTTLMPVDKLVLVTTYPSIVEVAQRHYPIYPIRLLLKDNFTPERWLLDYGGELLLVHGAEDSLLPIDLSRKLFNSVRAVEKEFLEVRAGHNSIYTGEVMERIKKFWFKL